MATSVNIRDLRNQLERLLRTVPGIGAVGIAWTPTGKRCLRVNVEPGFAQLDKIPTAFEGVQVTVQTAGDARLITVT